MDQKLFKRAQNYSKHVQWVIKTYEDSIDAGFIHGFQKDSIQNAAGARKNQHSFSGWKCIIDVRKTSKGTFVIVEDFGTVGLTGKNYSIEELDEMTSTKDATIPPDQRLARISVDNSSGGDTTSAGLYGVGKTLYVAASKSYWNYFESITENEGYRCNMNKNNEMLERALEGEAGKTFIQDNTGLEPIDHVGTRFIIVDPNPELIQAIEDGTLLSYVEETWWRIIKRITNTEDGIFVGGKRASVPAVYNFPEDKELLVKDSFFTKEIMKDEDDSSLKSKKIGFFINDKIPEELRGFYFYRRGMKIGKIDLGEYEIQFGKPYFGFIELDEEWEEQLARYENSTHYNVTSRGKLTAVYKALKTMVKKTVSELLLEWGYTKTRESHDQVLSKLVEEVQEELGDLLAENGYESIGKGDRKNKIDIRLSNVRYPNEDDPKNARSLYTGESLSFDYTIINRMQRTAKIQLSISTVKSNNTVIQQLSLENIDLSGNDNYQGSFIFKPTVDNSDENSVNGLLITIKLVNGNKIISRKLIYYFKRESEIQEDQDFELDLHSYQFPDMPNKGRRVDTDESITGVSYSMVSRLNKPIKVVLRVMALDTNNNNEPIETVFEREYVLPANGEPLISDPFDIKYAKEVYYPKLRKGIVTIRAKMGLREMLPESKLRKGAVLDEYEFKTFFNKPEKAGPEIKIILLEEPGLHKRSWIVETEKNTIAVNISHPEYLALVGRELQLTENYIMEQAAQESVRLYAAQGMFDEEFGADISSFDYLKRVNEKIEEIWYQICLK